MEALVYLIIAIATSVAVWTAFAYKDAKAAFDDDPGTITASSRIKHWIKAHGKTGRRLVALAIGAVGIGAAILTMWLSGHLL